jgi:SAM-dependent methyltransferase
MIFLPPRRVFGRDEEAAISEPAVPPALFDRALLRRRLRRALGQGASDFLLAHAAAELAGRLAFIQRSFRRAVDIGTPGAALAESLVRRSLPEIVRLAPVVATTGGAPILGVVADLEALPLAAVGFDLAVSALALQVANDLPGTLVQIRRALKPDGLFLACLIGGASLTELRAALAAADAEMSGGISPRVAPFADVRDMGALLQRAGFALPVADSEPLTVRYGSLFALMADLRAMGATNALVARLRHPTPRRLFLRAAEIYAERFSDADGRVRATFELIFVSGWAPHDSQQKPAKRGSANVRLADALAATRKSKG